MGCSDLTSLEDYEKITKEMEMILDNIPGLVFYKDTMNNLIRVNKYFADAHHSKKEELAGKNCFDLYPQIQAQAYWEDDLEVIKSGVPKLNIEEPWETEEGKKWVCTNKIPYIDDDGNIKGIVGFSVDITERKKIERKLKKYQNQLEKLVDERTDALIISEKKFQNIIENTQDVILIVGFDGKIKYISPQIYKLLGVEEVKIGTEFLSYVHPDDRDYVINLYKKGVKQKHSLKDIVLELRAFYRDGNYLWLSSSTKTYYDHEGNVVGFISSLRDITNRKIAEEKLRESEVKFRNLVENVSDAIIETELGGKFKYASPQIQNIVGYTPDEVIGLKSGKRIHPDDFERLVKAFKRASRSGERISIECRVRHKEGYYVPVSLRGHIVKEKGKYRHIGIVGDISEKIIAEQKLRDSEKRYKDLFENSPHPIIIATIDGKIIDCNSTTVVVFGYKKEEILNNEFTDISSIISRIISKQKENKAERFKERVFSIKELKVKRKDGNFAWIKIQPSLITLERGIYIYFILQEITKIKQSERELKELEQSIEEIRALIETAPLAILLIHPNGKIIRVNEEAEVLFNYSSNELLNLEIFQLFSPNDSNKIKKHYNKDIYNLSVSSKIEPSIKAKGGKFIDVEVTSTILKIADNFIIQSFFSNISERKNYERQRELMLDQLLTSLEFKTKFLTTISHDLRTPLNAILGFSSILLEDSYGKTNVNQKDFLRDIHTAGTHLLTLINSILDLSKIEAKKFKLEIKEFNLKQTLIEIQSTVKPLYEKKDLSFKIRGISKNTLLRADPLRFKQIMYNLVENAIKFTNEGTITLKCIERRDHWEFQVKDTGFGIAKEDFDVVFREYGRVENDIIKNIPGTGLGLALTKRLVNLHGGEIWFESELGKGTIFYITISKTNKYA